jgi:hypothetical protein
MPTHVRLLGIGPRLGLARLLGIGGLRPVFGPGRRFRTMGALALSHFELLSVMTAHRAVTTEAPRRPNGAGGEGSRSWKWSGLTDAMDQARRIEERVHFIDELLDVERDLDSLFDIANVGADLGRLGDARRPLQANP